MTADAILFSGDATLTGRACSPPLFPLFGVIGCARWDKPGKVPRRKGLWLNGTVTGVR
jgi:hypothetical protein